MSKSHEKAVIQQAKREAARAEEAKRKRCAGCRASEELAKLLAACEATKTYLSVQSLHELLAERVKGYDLKEWKSLSRHLKKHQPELWAKHYG